jgi:hypothetical protein
MIKQNIKKQKRGGFVAAIGRQKPENSPSFLVEKRVLAATRRTQ